ncbi:MAG: putative Ig domain-containing protein [Synergistaceae bacterium]|nr:putative Ig domain-containing protein [Synergistaceae bacterium]
MNLLNNNNVWQAGNLPDGFSFSDGVLSGNPSARGVYDVPVTVSNSLGSSTKNIRIIAKYSDDVTILQNGSALETIRLPALIASIQDGTAQSKYNCTNTQILINITHPINGSVVLDVPLNFCSFRTVALQDSSTKTGLILQFAHALWKGLAPFSTNNFNRWKYSQLRKWLNSSGADWFTSSYTADTLTAHEGCYTDAEAVGFMSCLPPALAEALVPVKLITQAFFDDNNEDNSIDDPDYINGYDADVTYDKVFVPSLSEMAVSAGSNENFPDDGVEGAAWDYYSALSGGANIAQDLEGNACSITTRSSVINGTTQVIYVNGSLQPFTSGSYSTEASPAPAFVLA